MRIYIFVPHYPSLFKPYYDNQFSDLVAQGHEVHVFALGTLDSAVNEKVAEYRLAERTTRYYPDDLRSLPAFAPRLVRSALAVPGERIRAGRRVAAASANWRSRVKSLARMLTLPADAPDLCMVHGVRTMKLFPWLRAVYPEARIVLFYHGGGLVGASPGEVFGRADAVFTNTGYSVREAVSLGCAPEKLVILPVGFDLSQYSPARPRLYRPGGTLRLLSASRFGEEKGHVYAVEAIAHLVRRGKRNLHYTIVGSGAPPMREAIESCIRRHSLEAYVTFAGSPSTRGVIAAMGEADVLLLPSHEHRGIVEMQAACVQEAMLMEALVVTTQTGGVPESIPEEMRPFSVECRSAEAIAGAIVRIDALPEEEIRDLAQRSRAWVEEHYDIRNLNTRMLQAIHARANPQDGTRSRPGDPANSLAPVVRIG